jgi:hypothetical protein
MECQMSTNLNGFGPQIVNGTEVQYYSKVKDEDVSVNEPALSVSYGSVGDSGGDGTADAGESTGSMIGGALVAGSIDVTDGIAPDGNGSAVVAYSIAGSGGSASSVYGAGENFVTGGYGGQGGDAGGVSITASGDINVSGNTNDGLNGFVLGGAGGAGGDVTGWNVGGGHGGAGGNAGNVAFNTDDAYITTTGTDGYGVAGGSVGGDGGAGGGDTDAVWNNDGGSGGAGGSAGATTFTLDAGHSGSITTSGNGANGVNLVNWGGNGGMGGSVMTQGGSPTFTAGGAGADGGAAGSVTATVGGNLSITIDGDDADGMLLMGTGGNGGAAGNAISAKSNGGGASGGAGGNGAALVFQGEDDSEYDIPSNTTMTTNGTADNGLVLTSVGGNGGAGGYDGGNDGSGGAGGTGGDIEIDPVLAGAPGGTLTIDTTDGNGIDATSVGGSGGTSGGNGAGSNAGAGGAGGSIDFVLQGDTSYGTAVDITVGGEGQKAINLDSAGGAGGWGGANGGGGGAGGNIDYGSTPTSIGPGTSTTITLTAADQFGILADSDGAGSSGSDAGAGGMVSVDFTGTIEAGSGDNIAGSTGILAESTGSGGGLIDVTVEAGSVVDGGANGSAICLIGGATESQNGGNELINYGTVADPDGYAIYSSQFGGFGYTTVTNEAGGSITGAVNLAAGVMLNEGVVDFIGNSSVGTYTQSGAGASTTFSGNNSLTASGGVNIADGTVNVDGTTTVNGNYAQTGGTLVFDVASNGDGGFNVTSLAVSGTLAVENTNIEIDFASGANPQTFANDGLLNLDTFITDGAMGNMPANLAMTFFNDTFTVNGLPGQTIQAIDLDSGTLYTNDETVSVAGNDTVEIFTPSQQSVNFVNTAQGGETLVLSDSQGFTGTISGFSSGDQLDLKDITFGGQAITPTFSGNSSEGTLTVQSGTEVAKITLLGNYVSASFTATSDGNGGTIITEAPQSPGDSVAGTPTLIAVHH